MEIQPVDPLESEQAPKKLSMLATFSCVALFVMPFAVVFWYLQQPRGSGERAIEHGLAFVFVVLPVSLGLHLPLYILAARRKLDSKISPMLSIPVLLLVDVVLVLLGFAL